LSLGHELALAFAGSAVRVATDVKAAAAAEAWSGALAGHDPAIYVNLGTGLAVAIICGGRVVSGANGAAGEIGYNLRQLSDLEPNQSKRVVLEEVVSGMGLSASGRLATGQEMSAAEVFAHETDDARLADVMERFVDELCFHLANLAVAIDPSRIAVGGGMVRSWSRLEAPIRHALEAAVPFPPELVVGAYPFDAPLVGALNLALAAVSETADGIHDDNFAIVGQAALPPHNGVPAKRRAEEHNKVKERSQTTRLTK
jgi:glucokinase